MRELPLQGIRVIDFGQIYAGPYCTSQLAYLGAEVIKIEPLGSGEYLRMPQSAGGASYAFLLLNANKKSIALNLKHPRGHEIILSLLADADVLVENYLEGVMEKLGLGYTQLSARFPRLIYASGKGYGTDSRWSRLGAMDYTVQAACGMVSVTGYPDRPGVRTPQPSSIWEWEFTLPLAFLPRLSHEAARLAVRGLKWQCRTSAFRR